MVRSALVVGPAARNCRGHVRSARCLPLRAAWLTALGFLCLLSLYGITSAQESNLSTDTRERIRHGISLYEAGQYEAAIDVLKPFAKGNYRAIYRIYEAHQKLNRTRQFIDFA